MLRELIVITEDARHAPSWAQTMIDVLVEAKDAVADTLDTQTLAGLQDRYRQASYGIAANPYAGTGPAPWLEPWPCACGTAPPSTSGAWPTSVLRSTTNRG
ncbi:hypothetical protein ABT215_35960 [Streptomyces sp900105755]|uniref:hypothetical protein n=1 Tax=Streptomyces sp. 900105755 TaxID=3154389 RepID=UPI00331F6CFF